MDAEFAVGQGIDALGFNLYAESPRFISLAQAGDISNRLPPYISRVALLVNETEQQVRQVVESGFFDLLQFHGDEDNDFCRQFGMRFIKVLRVEEPSKLGVQVATFPDSTGVLLDAYKPGQYGGTGQVLPWSGLGAIDLPLVLAGGLNADNVGLAISEVKPWAVDVSSGVEMRPGRKDHGMISSFIRAVNAADTMSNG